MTPEWEASLSVPYKKERQNNNKKKTKQIKSLLKMKRLLNEYLAIFGISLQHQATRHPRTNTAVLYGRLLERRQTDYTGLINSYNETQKT